MVELTRPHGRCGYDAISFYALSSQRQLVEELKVANCAWARTIVDEFHNIQPK